MKDLLKKQNSSVILPERSAPVVVLDCVDSTNDRLSRMALDGAVAGTVLIARRQTAGRGRMSRFFESPENGLYLSILEKPHTDPAKIRTVTPLAAIALIRTVQTLTDISPGEDAGCISIKWPNDVQIGSRKICGILTELHTAPEPDAAEPYHLIIGIGVNVNTDMSELSEKVREQAGNIAEAAGKRLDPDEFAEKLITEFDRLYKEWENETGSIIEEYRNCCSTAGKDIFLYDTANSAGSLNEAGCRSAFVCGINDDFSLNVLYEDGSRGSVISGEVSVRVRNSPA